MTQDSLLQLVLHTLCGCCTFVMPWLDTFHCAEGETLLLSSTGGTFKSRAADRYRPSALQHT